MRLPFRALSIFCENYSSPHIQNCTLVGNSSRQGGGIWCVWGCFPVLESCLVAFASRGGGVYVYGNPGNPSTVMLICSDVFGSQGGDYGGAIADRTGLNGNISLDPLSCDVQLGDFRLRADSPCAPASVAREEGTLAIPLGERSVD